MGGHHGHTHTADLDLLPLLTRANSSAPGLVMIGGGFLGEGGGGGACRSWCDGIAGFSLVGCEMIGEWGLVAVCCAR